MKPQGFINPERHHESLWELSARKSQFIAFPTHVGITKHISHQELVYNSVNIFARNFHEMSRFAQKTHLYQLPLRGWEANLQKSFLWKLHEMLRSSNKPHFATHVPCGRGKGREGASSLKS